MRPALRKIGARLRAGGWGATLPLSGVVLLALTISAFILSTLIAKLDADAARQTRATVAGALEGHRASMAGSAFSTARWDDAVRHLYGGFDSDWAMANLAGNSVTYIIDGEGRTLFAMRVARLRLGM